MSFLLRPWLGGMTSLPSFDQDLWRSPFLGGMMWYSDSHSFKVFWYCRWIHAMVPSQSLNSRSMSATRKFIVWGRGAFPLRWSGMTYLESTNLSFGKIVICVLSRVPWSLWGCLDKKSAAEWFFPGVIWMKNQ